MTIETLKTAYELNSMLENMKQEPTDIVEGSKAVFNLVRHVTNTWTKEDDIELQDQVNELLSKRLDWRKIKIAKLEAELAAL